MKFILGIYVTQTQLAYLAGANSGGEMEKSGKRKKKGKYKIRSTWGRFCEPVRLSKPHKPFFSLKVLDTKPPLGRCYIIMIPLSFFLSPNPLPLLTPATQARPNQPLPSVPPYESLTDAAPLFLKNERAFFTRKRYCLPRRNLSDLRVFQFKPHRLNWWGEKFCLLYGRNRTAIKTNKYQGTPKKKRSTPQMDSYIPRCKISFASLCQD